MPDEMQPNKSGVIVMLDRHWRGRPVIAAMPTGEKIPQESMEWLKQHAVATSTPLILIENLFENGKYQGYRQQGFGPPAFIQAVRNHAGLDDIILF